MNLWPKFFALLFFNKQTRLLIRALPFCRLLWFLPSVLGALNEKRTDVVSQGIGNRVRGEWGCLLIDICAQQGNSNNNCMDFKFLCHLQITYWYDCHRGDSEDELC